MTTIPSGSPYDTIADSYLDPDYANKVVGFGTQKDKLWATFLKENGLMATDPLVVAQDPAILTKFVAFLQKTYDSMQVNTLSPDEVTRRDLMFTVYDLVVLILEVLQRSVGVVGGNVVFLNKYAKEYSNMMAREAEAFYVGGSLSLPQVNRNDLSKWTLGYDEITMKEFIEASVYRPYIPNPDPSNPANAISYNSTPYTYSISSVNTAYPPLGPNVQQNDRAILKDTLASVRQTEFIALGPLTRDVYRDVGPTPADATFYGVASARNTLTFSAPTSSSVTMSYTYWTQYNSTAVYYGFDSDGNFISSDPSNTAFQRKGYYPTTVTSPPVNFGPNDTPEQKIAAVEAGFQAFLNQTIPNGSIWPPSGPPPPPSPYTNFWYSFSNIPVTGRNISIYDSTTQPITYWGVSNTFPPGADVTVIQNLTKPWHPEHNLVFTTTTDDTAKIYTSAASRRRGNSNSLLQQFVSNTQSKRQIITNQADATQSNMDSIQTGYNQGASLLKTMIGQLSTILTSIFQGAR